jgi:hypothetical protein
MENNTGNIEKTNYYRIPLIMVGLYLMAGATYTFDTNKWFAGFPPMLDVLNILPHGRYIEAAIAAVVGAALVLATLVRPRQKVSHPDV